MALQLPVQRHIFAQHEMRVEDERADTTDVSILLAGSISMATFHNDLIVSGGS